MSKAAKERRGRRGSWAALVIAATLALSSAGCLPSALLPSSGALDGGGGRSLLPGRSNRRFVPRVTQRPPAFYEVDSQGGVSSEPTPTDDDTWWIIVRGQF